MLPSGSQLPLWREWSTRQLLGESLSGGFVVVRTSAMV
jgi:hypothetical protein